jgi:hypothetical protein
MTKIAGSGSISQRRGSGSTPKCHGSATLQEGEGAAADHANAAAAQLPSLEAVREEVRAELKRKRKMEEESEDDENDITLLGKYGTECCYHIADY